MDIKIVVKKKSYPQCCHIGLYFDNAIGIILPKLSSGRSKKTAFQERGSAVSAVISVAVDPSFVAVYHWPSPTKLCSIS